jgi:hypothetical protein
MRSLYRRLQVFAAHWWALPLTFALNTASLLILFWLEDRFEALSGVPTFDTQNDLTAATLLNQLPRYQGEAASAYAAFSAFDFIFPFVSALFITVLWFLLLRLNKSQLAATLLRVGLPLFPLFTTLADYLENVSLLSILNAGGIPAPALIQMALLFKQTKLTLLSVDAFGTVLLIGFLLGNGVYQWVNRQRHLAL